MLNDAICFKAVYIVCGYTDLRSGIDSLATVLETQTGRNPYVPVTLYLFCGRRADRIKGLVWERGGWLMLYKRRGCQSTAKIKTKEQPCIPVTDNDTGHIPRRKDVKISSSEERQNRRQLSIRPLVEAYFTWVRENISKVSEKRKAHEGFGYCLSQEKYLKVFLDDGEVLMDNNAAGQSICGFCIEKKNWVMIATITSVKSSAIIYSIAETAKANNLKLYDYFEYLLTEIPKHLNDTDRSFCENLLPW